MTETLQPETLQPATEPVIQRPHRLFQAVAWVAIVAGVVFVVATIFFAGFFLGRASDGGGHRHGHAMLLHHKPPMRPGTMPPPGMEPGREAGTEPGMAPPPEYRLVPSPPSQSPNTPPARP